MKIHAGFEISYDCPQPTPMILTLSVYPSRVPDLLTPDRIRIDPAVPVNTYHDTFGNFCHVIRAPAGRLVGNKIVHQPSIDVGFAVEAEDGVLVPVLRDVPERRARDRDGAPGGHRHPAGPVGQPEPGSRVQGTD